MRGATQETEAIYRDLYISTHAPHARRDWTIEITHPIDSDFYSRASCEARPQYLVCFMPNIAIAPIRGGHFLSQ